MRAMGMLLLRRPPTLRLWPLVRLLRGAHVELPFSTPIKIDTAITNRPNVNA